MKKRKILIACATAFALLFNFQVAFAADADAAIVKRSVDKLEKDEMIEYGKSKSIIYHQDKSVTIDLARNKEVVLVMDTSIKSTLPDDPDKNPFNYALFSGSEKETLVLHADKVYIDGKSHSNSAINMNLGGSSVITSSVVNEDGSPTKGAITAPGGASDITIMGALDRSTFDLETQSVIKMPDLSGRFSVDAGLSHSKFSTDLDPEDMMPFYLDAVIDGSIVKTYIGKNLKYSLGKDIVDREYYDIVSGEVKSKKVEINKWSISGEELTLSKERPLYFDGDVVFSVEKFSGSGFIVATGDITFNAGVPTDLGLKYKEDGTVDLENSAEIGFYSTAGDINFNLGAGAKFKGLIYAPGTIIKNESGEVVFESGGKVQTGSDAFEIYGTTVARTLQAYGNKKIVYTDTSLKDELGENTEDRSNRLNAIEAAKVIINELSSLKGSNVKIGTVVYSDYAKKLADINNDDTDYIINAEDETNKGDKDALIEVIKSINGLDDKSGSNLGDGLRLAYHMLNDSDDKKAEKYIVVFSYNVPDKWTTSDKVGEKYRKDNVEIKEGIENTTTIDDASDYAIEIGKMINVAGFKGVYFIDSKAGSKLNNINDIAKATGADKNDDGEYMYNPESDLTEDKDKKDFFDKFSQVVKTISQKIAVKSVLAVESVEVRFNNTDEGKLHKLPDGVVFIESTDFILKDGLLELSDPDSVLELSIDKKTATIKDLSMDVKFNKITNSAIINEDPIQFKEAELIYKFNIAGEDSIEVPVLVEPLEVRVEYKVDIQ